MTLWFLRGLRRGVATTRYPSHPDSSAALLPTPPSFRAAALTQPVADRLCAACPAGALRREPGVLVYDVGACTACGRCIAAVPGVATPSGEFELATWDRAALVRRFPVAGDAQ